MAREYWDPCSILSPVPAVIVTVRSKEGKDNALTIAWAGTICSNPSMVSISVRKERFSYPILMDTKEFVINLTTKSMVRATDFIGVRSGKDMDKIKETGLHTEEAKIVNVPIIKESPIAIECKVKETMDLGSHTMFLAEVVQVDVDQKYLDQNGKLDLDHAELVSYAHGTYYALGEKLGTFGYSVRKK